MTKLSDLPLRATLVGKEPYGAPQDTVAVRLNVNENTYPLSESVREDIVQSLANAVQHVNRYPDREFTALRSALADYLGYGLTVDNIWAANGSNEVLQQILQAFGGPGRTLLSFDPTYSMYPILAAATDTGWLSVQRPAGYHLTPEFVAEALQKHSPDIVVLCGPNNPTGTPLDSATVVAAYDAFEGMLIIDEAYFEFETVRESAVSLLEGRPRLLVSRTMSKAFAFAGVRLGYLAADPAVIDALRLVRLPYHLSALTQAAAEAALRHSAEMLSTVADIRAQRVRLEAALKELGFVVHESGANFLFVGGFSDPQATFQKLYERGILIRNVGIEGHLRFTVGTPEETTAVINAMREIAQHS